MSHNILVKNAVDEKNNALNRSAWSASALDNGWVFSLLSQSAITGYSEVWLATQPSTGSLSGLWMASDSEVILTDSKYKGINPDPRDFNIATSTVFTAFKPMPGDIITITADALNDSTTQAFAIAKTTNYEFEWSDNPVGTDTMCLRYLDTTYIPVGSGSAMGDSRVVAYQFEVLYN